MKMLLINPPIREWAKPNCFPTGLGYIAAVLLKDGFEVEVLDINGYRFTKEEVEKKIRDAHFDVAGIGGIVTTYKYVKWLVPILKKYHPDKKVIVGGSVATSIPHIMMEKNPVDILCIGEGEVTAPELMRALEKNDDPFGVKGIWYRDKSGDIVKTARRPILNDLDALPFPAWDLFPMDIYLKNPVGAINRNKWIDGSAENAMLSMNLFATRGCPYQCIYCYHDFMGDVYRHRSAENVVSEIEYLYNKHKIPYFHFIDDEFIMDKKFVYRFCELMNELSEKVKQKIAWGCTARVNLVTEDMVKTMADAGCLALGYGIETGSQKMLNMIKKGVTVEQAKYAINISQKYMGWASCAFMIGYPGETKETIQETIDFCKEVNLTPQVFFFITPYPGTELYRMAMAQGKIKDEEEYVLGLGEQGEKININFTDFSNEELMKIQEDMVKELNAWNKIKHAEVKS